MRNFIIASVLVFLAHMSGFAQPWYQGTNPPSVFNSASSNSYRMGNVGIGNFTNAEQLIQKKIFHGSTNILHFSIGYTAFAGDNINGKATNSMSSVGAVINFQ